MFMHVPSCPLPWKEAVCIIDFMMWLLLHTIVCSETYGCVCSHLPNAAGSGGGGGGAQVTI